MSTRFVFFLKKIPITNFRSIYSRRFRFKNVDYNSSFLKDVNWQIL